jgi:hypothetical protein
MAIEEGAMQGRRVGEFLVQRIKTRAPVSVAAGSFAQTP